MVRLYSKSLPAAHRGKTSRRIETTYGVGAGEVVVVVVVSVAGGVVVVAGGIVVVAGGVIVVAPAGDGFTIVVLFVTAGDGDAAVVVVVGWTSVRCSHDTRSAALARMQRVFFIGLIGLALVGLTSNRTNGTVRTCLSECSRGRSAEFLL